MRARLSDHYLEIALFGAIAEKNNTEALKAIKNILEYQGRGRAPSLAHTDEYNVSFLQFALDSQLPAVVKALLDTGVFNDNAAILFKTSGKGRTLICQAAKQGYADIVEQLYKLSIKLLSALPLDQQADSPGYKIWLKPDLRGNTPLHYAAINKVAPLYKFLVGLISSDTDAVTPINQKNKEGNAPLHLALMGAGEPDVNLIHLLLDAGADWGCVNQDRMTPFGLLCQHEIHQQVTFLRRLDDRLMPDDETKSKARQRIFKPHDRNTDQLLQYYKDYLAAHWEDERIRKVYFSYMSLQGLADVAIATLELNPGVVPQSDYLAGESKISISSEVIEDPELARRLPLYNAKLVSSKGIFAFSNHQSVQHQRLLAQDKGDIDKLIRQIDGAIQEWTVRKPLPVNKITTVLLPALGWLAYGAVEAYLIYSAVNISHQTPTTFTYHGEPILGPHEGNHPKYDHFECHREDGYWSRYEYSVYEHRHWLYKDYYVFHGPCETNLDHQYSLYKWWALGVGLGGAFANAGITSMLRRYLWDKEVILTIPESEWRAMRQSVQVLSDKLNQHTDGNLPTASRNIQALDEALVQLKGSMSQQETIAIFTRVSTILNVIRADLNVYCKPISRCLPDLEEVVIEREEFAGVPSDQGDEVIPLLGAYLG